MTALAVALAGAAGAVARAFVDAVAIRRWRAGLWGTFAVNVSGSLAAGVLVGLVLDHGLSDDARLVVGVGFLGAYTTFSTHAVQVVALAREGQVRSAALHAATSAAVALAAAGAGLAVALAR